MNMIPIKISVKVFSKFSTEECLIEVPLQQNFVIMKIDLKAVKCTVLKKERIKALFYSIYPRAHAVSGKYISLIFMRDTYHQYQLRLSCPVIQPQ